jgi:hypothetical protein
MDALRGWNVPKTRKNFSKSSRKKVEIGYNKKGVLFITFQKERHAR